MNLVSIAARVAGAQMDILKDIGHVEGSIQAEAERALKRLTERDGFEKAYADVCGTMAGAYEKIYSRKSALRPGTQIYETNVEEGRSYIAGMLHEDFHEAANPKFGLREDENPLMDAMHEAYIKSVQHGENRSSYGAPISWWNDNFEVEGEPIRETLQKYADASPEPYKRLFNIILRRYDRNVSARESMTLDTEWDAWGDAWNSSIDESVEVLSNELEGKMRKYVGLLAKRLRSL